MNSVAFFLKYQLLIILFVLRVSSQVKPPQGISPAQMKELQNEIDSLQDTLAEDRNKEDDGVHTLTPGIEKLLVSSGHKRLEIFCYSGEPRSIVTLLKTVELVVKVPKENFHYYEGANASHVQQQYEEQSWFSFPAWRPSSFRMDIYNYSCIGVETSETFRIHFKIRYIDLWRVVTLVAGVSLFLTAPLLAPNVFFHYMTGVSIGIFGSLLVFVFLVSRLVPKKTGAVTVLVGGWGLVLYLLQHLWSNCLNLIKEHQTIAAGYVTLAGLISFAVVYRKGPIVDVRSLRLVQWSLQLVGLGLTFGCSQCKEFTLLIVLLLLTHYNIPLSWKFKVKTLWLRRFPPKRELLSEDEYFEEARVETKHALKELREFCHSPDCNAWKTMSKLKSPQRFAEYVEGGCHLMDDEILAYESDTFDLSNNRDDEDLFTTDEDDGEADVDVGVTSLALRR